MIYLLGDNNGKIVEPMLRDKNWHYRSYLGLPITIELTTSPQDILLFFGTKEQQKVVLDKHQQKCRVLVVGKNQINPDVLLPLIKEIAELESQREVTLTYGNVPDLDEMSQYLAVQDTEGVEIELVDGQQVRLVPDSRLGDEPNSTSFSLFLLVIRTVNMFKNIKKCIIKRV